MLGCGACSLPNNIDLSGNLTLFDKNKEKYEQIKLDKEMVRSICSDKINEIIYVGTISGKIIYLENSVINPESINEILWKISLKIKFLFKNEFFFKNLFIQSKLMILKFWNNLIKSIFIKKIKLVSIKA